MHTRTCKTEQQACGHFAVIRPALKRASGRLKIYIYIYIYIYICISLSLSIYIYIYIYT